MAWKTLDDMVLGGKRVLVRIDINVPVEGGRVTDTTRIDRIAPTLRHILYAGGLPVLMAHFGRPEGRVVPELSLAVVVPALQTALGRPVTFAADDPAATVAAMAPGDVVLLENLRFDPGEAANDPAFAAELARLGDIYCNDAFSAAHRAHASTAALARLLPACAGRLMAAELGALEAALGAPERPLAALVGGAKISTKIALLGNLVRKVGRALAQLGIELIPAYSPEARGRSERMFGTLQKRLPQELRLAGITDMVEANRFLKEVFLPQHNARFATPAEDRGTAFVPFTGALDDILCIHEERTVSNDNTVRYKRLALQIPAGRHRRHYVKARVRVHEYPDGTMAVFHGPRCLARYHADGQPIDSQTREAA